MHSKGLNSIKFNLCLALIVLYIQQLGLLKLNLMSKVERCM